MKTGIKEQEDIHDDDEMEVEETLVPDYYQCMCCGNIQSRSYTCNKCAGPMYEGYY